MRSVPSAYGIVRPTGAVALSLSLTLAACATARLNQFSDLAQTGTAYVGATQSVIQAAGVAAINADSALLLNARPDLTPSERRARIMRSDELLTERLHVLELLSAHGKVLQEYFQALGALADPKAPDSVGRAAKGLYDSLTKVSPTLRSAKLGTATVSDFIETASAPIVAAFRARALTSELKARSAAIANEIALEQAAFAALSSELQTDTQLQRTIQETALINAFSNAPTLPPTWASERLMTLMTSSSISAIGAAEAAAGKLQEAFVAAVEGRLDASGVASLMSDISNVHSLTKTVEATIR